MTDNEKLAHLLFPDITESPEALEERFPPRRLKEGARVTRFAPSPTGFLHIGGLFAALISRLNASVTDGVFMLRIEDTDKKREITDGVTEIIKGLSAFGITIDEGVTGFETEKGEYGPYHQSKRAAIYHVIAKKLVEDGLAYPCFCTEEELSALREKQEEEGAVIKGYFGKWAACRGLSFEEQKARIESGAPYTLRLRSRAERTQESSSTTSLREKLKLPKTFRTSFFLRRTAFPPTILHTRLTTILCAPPT